MLSTIPHHMNGRTPVFIGDSSAITDIKKLIARIAPTDMTVLITGESGTGKELIARMIHHHSKRALFKAINCAALPTELVESELFGHERGAFTGACARRIGLLEEAEGSTLLLDEITEMPLSIQVKLLRVLEEREIQRLGSNRSIKINVRIIAATNRLLDEEVKAGRFRFDLYYRLQACEMNIEPLRERRSDIRQLAAHFAVRFANAGQPAQFTQEALCVLEQYLWPGNVRELANAVEFAVNTCVGGVISVSDLPWRVRAYVPEGEGKSEGGEAVGTLRLSVPALSMDNKWHADTSRLRSERTEAARRKVDECSGNKSQAAKELGITRQWLYKLLEEAKAEA